MTLSRRSFVRTLGIGGAGAWAAGALVFRGREALVGHANFIMVDVFTRVLAAGASAAPA